MFVTVHAAAATIIGKNVSSTALAFILGIISHYILDMIPHGDQDLGKKFFGLRFKQLKQQNYFKFMALYGTMDSFILAIYLMFIFNNFGYSQNPTIIWAIIGGILPDFLALMYKLTEIRFLSGLNKIHEYFHMLLLKRLNKDLPLRLGVLLQICLLIILVWVIIIT